MIDTRMDRRSFLSTAGLFGGGALLTSCAPKLMANQSGAAAGRSLNKVGIQLYTVRDMLKADYIKTAKLLKAIGYDQVEYAELPGMPFTTKEFKKVADGEGLEIPSCGFQPEHFFKEFQYVIDVTSGAGAKYAFNGWIHPPDRTLPNLMKQCEAFNRFGSDLQKFGLKYMYHNHDFEFSTRIDANRTIFDVLVQNTDPKLVDFEMDMYWVTHGGGNIVEYLTKYPDRYVACHIKDRTADGKMVYVGEGVIDWKTALRKAQDVGIKYYYMEHDEPAAPVEEGIRSSYRYIRDLRF